MTEAKRTFTVTINDVLIPVKDYSGGVISSAEAGLDSSTVDTISELQLEAYVASDSNILSDIAHKVANSDLDELATIIITETSQDKTLQKATVYGKCLLAAFDYPTLKRNASSVAIQTVTFKPTTIHVS